MLEQVEEAFWYFVAQQFIQGRDLFDQGEFRRALEYFNYAIECEENIVYYEYRGRALFAMRDYDGAIKDFGEAIKLEPNVHADLYVYRGRAYFETREIDKVIADLDGPSVFNRMTHPPIIGGATPIDSNIIVTRPFWTTLRQSGFLLLMPMPITLEGSRMSSKKTMVGQ